MPPRSAPAVLRAFHCEHTPGRSRVLALVDRPAGPASLQAVLTCKQPELAHLAARLLQRAVDARGGATDAAWDPDALEELCGRLPDAPAASLRGAVEHARAGTWPAVAGTVLEWERIPGAHREAAGEAGAAERTGEEPDFAALFALEDPHCEDAGCEDERCGWQLTPRTAAALHRALCRLADDAHDEAVEIGDGPVTRDRPEAPGRRGAAERPGEGRGVFGRLPSLTFRTDSAWRRRFVRALDDLCDDLETGRWPQPVCTAEEIALHLALEDVRADREEGEDVDGDGPLPVHPDDHDYDLCAEMLFQDDDVLLLHDVGFDGIEDPDDGTNQQLRMGDLRPAAWFEPFLNVEPRHPGSTPRTP